MVSSGKKKEKNKNRRLLSQLDDFDQDAFIGDAVNSEKQNNVVNSVLADQGFAAFSKNIDSLAATLENTVDFQTLERNFSDSMSREMSNIFETVKNRIQSGHLTAMIFIITPRIELGVESVNALSVRNVACVTANSERGEQIGNSASYWNVSDKNSSFRGLNSTD